MAASPAALQPRQRGESHGHDKSQLAQVQAARKAQEASSLTRSRPTRDDHGFRPLSAGRSSLRSRQQCCYHCRPVWPAQLLTRRIRCQTQANAPSNSDSRPQPKTRLLLRAATTDKRPNRLALSIRLSTSPITARARDARSSCHRSHSWDRKGLILSIDTMTPGEYQKRRIEALRRRQAVKATPQTEEPKPE